MNNIPSQCPNCNSSTAWKEVINPLTTGIPLGKRGRFGRIYFVSLHIPFAEQIKNKLGFYQVTYYCHKCGFKSVYELPHD